MYPRVSKAALGAAVAAVFSLVTAGAASALAEIPMTISVQTAASVQARGALVTVLVDVSCAPLGGPYGDISYLNGLLTQSVDHRSETATSNLTLVPGTQLICDGTAHTYAMQGVPVAPGPPFRRGAAVFSASGSVCDAAFLTCASGQTPLVVVKLTRAG